jgi:hypothetical protein
MGTYIRKINIIGSVDIYLPHFCFGFSRREIKTLNAMPTGPSKMGGPP